MTSGRRRTLTFPREHGAWGILLVPLVTGAWIGLLDGGRAWDLTPLCISALAVFWLRTPAESWIGAAPIRARTPDEVRLVRQAVLILALVAAGALIWLFWGGRNAGLVGIGAAAGLAFLAQTAVKHTWRSARTAAQMVGAAGLTSTAPAAYYVVTGDLTHTAGVLWACNLLFAINQIHFVQLRIHAAHAATRSAKLSVGRAFLSGQLMLVALLIAAVASRDLPVWATVAFLPVLGRGFAWFAVDSKPLAIQALGKRELAYACAFGVLLVAGMRLA